MTDYTELTTIDNELSETTLSSFNSEENQTDDIHLWLRMLDCCTQIENELRSRIRSEFKTTLPRFDLMSKLAHEPNGLKMSELSRLMMVTNGNITGITDQLEKDGLVVRIKNRADRRSSIIRLTKKGITYQKKLEQAHANWVSSLLKDFTPKSRTTLFKLLGDLKQSTNTNLVMS